MYKSRGWKQIDKFNEDTTEEKCKEKAREIKHNIKKKRYARCRTTRRLCKEKNVKLKDGFGTYYRDTAHYKIEVTLFIYELDQQVD